MKHCKHTQTRIWEPHLAGAKKCILCNKVYNPNRTYINEDPWFFEISDALISKLTSDERWLLEYHPDSYSASMIQLRIAFTDLKDALKEHFIKHRLELTVVYVVVSAVCIYMAVR